MNTEVSSVRMVPRLLILFSMLAGSAVPQDTNDECRYYYAKQPNNLLECDPYINGQLVVGCELRHSNSESSIGRIMWIFESAESGTVKSLESDSEKYSIVLTTGPSSALTQLVVNNLGLADVGNYYCQGCFLNGTLLSPSRKLTLQPRGEYEGEDSTQCSYSEQFDETTIRCARTIKQVAIGCEVYIEPEVPTTQSTTVPPEPSTTTTAEQLATTTAAQLTTSTTAREATSTAEIMTTPAPNERTTTTAKADTPTTTMESSTIISPSTEDEPLTLISEAEDETTAFSPLNPLGNLGTSNGRLDGNDLLLYGAISAVLLFVMVLIVLLLVAGLCYFLC